MFVQGTGERNVHLERPPLTRIVATLGPATDQMDELLRVVASGATIFRLNFSHGSVEDHERRLTMVRGAATRTGRVLAVLGDLCGPKIRVGKVEAPGIQAHSGQDVVIDPSVPVSRDGDVPTLSCTYPEIAGEVEPGSRVLINDGAVRMLAVEREGTGLRCRVTVGGLISSGKGINLPDSTISAPAVTGEDRTWASWALSHGIDFLALSFVRRAEDVRELREWLSASERGESANDSCAVGEVMPIVAKIEKPEALENIDSILKEADGIMVARGDLGVELDVARVPVAQKQLIARARAFGKPCIVATQMLESMIERAGPTRAEASDVANAILDGADAVMLSGETAVGRHAALAVETMRRIAFATEGHLRTERRRFGLPAMWREARDVPAAIAHAAWTLYDDLDAALVIVWSEGGGTARRLSQNSINVPILAFSSDPVAVRRMAILRGVHPILSRELPQHRSEFAQMADVEAVRGGWARAGQPVVLVGGKPFGVPGTANTVAIRIAGALAGSVEE